MKNRLIVKVVNKDATFWAIFALFLPEKGHFEAVFNTKSTHTLSSITAPSASAIPAT